MRQLIFGLIYAFLLSCLLLPQADTVGDFIIEKDSNTVKILSLKTNVITILNFNHPSLDYFDFDEDSIPELLIIDSSSIDLFPVYWVYIYRLKDVLYRIDSISSGMKEPELVLSEELQQGVLICGFPEFNSINMEAGINTAFSPLNILLYNGESFYTEFDDTFQLLINENEEIFTFIAAYLNDNGRNCSNSKKLTAAFSSAVINFINAGENALAEHLLNSYYLCEDKNDFLNYIKKTVQEKL